MAESSHELGFYVAGTKLLPDPVARAIEYISAKGYHVTHDWLTISSSPDKTHPAVGTCDCMIKKIATQDMLGVFECDIFLLVIDSSMDDIHYRGGHVELGLAVATKKTVVVLDLATQENRRDNVFYHLSEVTLIVNETVENAVDFAIRFHNTPNEHRHFFEKYHT